MSAERSLVGGLDCASLSIGNVLEDGASLDKGILPSREQGVVEKVGLRPFNHFHSLIVDSVPHDIDKEAGVMTNVVLRLNYKLLESSHKVLDGLLALLKGKETFFCVSPDVWGLEGLLELIGKLVEGVDCI